MEERNRTVQLDVREDWGFICTPVCMCLGTSQAYGNQVSKVLVTNTCGSGMNALLVHTYGRSCENLHGMGVQGHIIDSEGLGFKINTCYSLLLWPLHIA